MVDFDALAAKLRKRVHKIHADYKCPKCGHVIRYVQVMPDHFEMKCEQWTDDGHKCRGQTVLHKRICVLRVICDARTRI